MSFLSAREKVGLTQKQVAETIGVDQSAVSFWETGKTSPRASILVKLSELYCCTLDELLDKKSEARTDTPPNPGSA